MMKPRVLAFAAVGAVALWASTRARPAVVRTGRPPVAVEAVAVLPSDVTESIDVVGSLAPKVSARIKSEYSGIVSAVHVSEWVAVRKGQPLATLDPREPQAGVASAEAALLQAQVAETRAVRERERAEKLRGVGLMTQQGVDDASSAEEAANAQTAAAAAQLTAARTRLAKTVIRAPFDGLVAFRGVNVGDRVESMGSGDAMFEIVDNRLLELTMSVPSTRLASLAPGLTIVFTVDSAPDREFRGRLTHLNPSVDPHGRAVRIVADVPNPDGALKGGLFVEGRIETGSRSQILQIPRTALQQWDLARGTAEVFVIEGELARQRSVRTGRVSGSLAEITEGLAPGERVATRGTFNLRPGDRVRVTPHDGT